MNFLERHADKIMPIPFSGCFVWMGSHNGKYGTVNIAHKICKAHRESFRATQPIPTGLWVLHSCDITFCVNPAHLFLGNRSDNMQDMVRKGRDNKTSRQRGEAWHQAHKNQGRRKKVSQPTKPEGVQ